MILSMEIDFHTDGDFWFLAKKLIDPQFSFYNGAVKEFRVLAEPYDEFYGITLVCEGDANGCRLAARDVIQKLICGGISVTHYWVLKYIYELIVPPMEELLWSDEDVHHYDTIGGNYEGTHITLDIVH